MAAVVGGFKMYAMENEMKKVNFEKLGASVFFSMNELERILNLEE